MFESECSDAGQIDWGWNRIRVSENGRMTIKVCGGRERDLNKRRVEEEESGGWKNGLRRDRGAEHVKSEEFIHSLKRGRWP
jgi:hypothetical protein